MAGVINQLLGGVLKKAGPGNDADVGGFNIRDLDLRLPIRNRERRMLKFAIRLLTLAMFSMALLAAPLFVSVCAASGDPTPSTPPATDTKSAPKKKKTSEIRPGIEDTAFVKGYHAAYATIYDRNDYAAAIDQLKALGHDDNP